MIFRALHIGPALQVIVLLLAACVPVTVQPQPTDTAERGVPTAQAGQPAPGGTLTIGVGYETVHYDPHAGNSLDQQYLHMHLFDPLVWRAPDGTFVPGLAERWEVSADARTFTFGLRRDVTFHDGTPFNAEAVKFSFDRITAPDFPAITTRGLLGPYAGTQVIDAYTVRVSFSEPHPAFLDALSQWWLVPVSPAAVAQAGADFGQQPVGTGPFMWSERVAQDHITLVRNPAYNWAPAFFNRQGPAYLERLVFKFIPEPAIRAGTLESGEILMAQDVSPVDLKRLAGNPDFLLYREVLPGMPHVLMLNTECTPTRDLAVRQALQWATPRQHILDTLWGGYFEPAYGPLTPGLLGYDRGLETLYGYDPERARQILEAAGWVDANGDGVREKAGEPLRLALNTMAFNRYPEVLQVVMAGWRDVGIDTTLSILTWPQFSGAAWACEHSVMPYFTPASDPYFVTNSFYLSSNVDKGFAFTRLRDPELDRLLQVAATRPTDAEREPAYQAATRRIMEAAVIVPLYVPYNLTLTARSVRGLQFSTQGWYPLFYDVYLQP